MTEPKVQIGQTTLLGVILTVIALSSGATYFIEGTGDYMTCPGGWELIEDTGQYNCAVREVPSQWCAKGSSPGPLNIGYRCYLGMVVKIEKGPDTEDLTHSEASQVTINANRQNYKCEAPNGQIHKYSTCKSGDDVDYLGELI